VAISADPKTANTSVGTNALFRVTVRNLSGGAASFRLRANSSLGWPVSVPAPFSVGAGGSTTLDVIVQVPGNATAGTRNNVSLLVEDTASPATRNSTRISVTALTNRPPNCASAAANPTQLWPPNHNFRDVHIDGITDPDGDSVTLAIQAITQDEPVRGPGSGDTAPDARGIGGSVASIRSERSGAGDGRVYAIQFNASDNKGGVCAGQVKVSVPHDNAGSAVDSGQLYDSTVE
jgi:hypothetical protein